MVEQQIQAILSGMGSAAIYTLIFYAKKKAKSGAESFDFRKLSATLVVGAIVGGFYSYYGMPITEANISEKLVTYTGTIALIESLIKFAYRQVKQRTELE